MSVDVSLISELFKTNGRETQGVLSRVRQTEDIMGVFSEDETVIKSTNTMGDAYDRGSRENNTDISDRTVTTDVLEKLTEVVNADNFSMYEELGLAPDKDDPTSILTVSERIDIELAAHCEDYKPTGSISRKDIEDLYGKSGLSYQIASELEKNNIAPDEKNISRVMESLEKVRDIKETKISSSAAEYLLTNRMNVTVDNVYKALHSVSDKQGGIRESLSENEWADLSVQAEKIMEKCGLNVNKETLNDARWLIETKIPLTGENLYKLAQLRDINENQTANNNISEGAWIEKIASDMAFLKEAGASSMDYYKTVKSDSIEAVTIINNGTDEQVEALMLDGKDVTLLNLKRYQEDGTRNALEERKSREDKKYNETDTSKQREIIAAKRYLAEAKLKLTVQSGALLIKNGINIDISSLSETVEELRKLENELASEIFYGIGCEVTEEKTEQFKNTTAYMKDFVNAPAYVLGSVYLGDINFTVEDMTVEGAVKENILRSAQAAYDRLGTKPSKALGDSVKKAFEGIADILTDLDMEDNEANNRAVRILSYNEIEITKENIQNIKEMDMQVSRLVDNLTPRTTAYLIANGINPLRTNIPELNEQLDELNQEIEADEIETYSEYLWKLEKNGEISKEEREAYIGIYRLLHMIEKSDRKAVGAVMKQGGGLTMRNLLTALRSVNNSGMDINIDDSLGLTQSVKLAENNIDNQLKSMEESVFYKKVKDRLSPELLKQALGNNNAEDTDNKGGTSDKNVMDMKLDEWLAYMSDKTYEMSDDGQQIYNELRNRELENLKYVSEDMLYTVMEDGMDSRVNNLLSINYIMNNSSGLYPKIKKVCENENTEEDINELMNGMEAASDENEDLQFIKEHIDKMTEDVKEAMLLKAEINAGDIRQINGAVNYIRNAANNNSYYVPVKWGGEQTLVRLTLKNGEKERGKANIRIFGSEDVLVEAEVSIKGSSIKINALKGMSIQECDEIQSVLADKWSTIYDKEGRKETDEEYVQNKNMKDISDKDLFYISKQFIFEINKYRKQTDI